MNASFLGHQRCLCLLLCLTREAGARLAQGQRDHAPESVSGHRTILTPLGVTSLPQKMASLQDLSSRHYCHLLNQSTNVRPQAMQTARLELKLSQKDLAATVNEKVSVLQDYESGKAIPNPQILGKLERALGVKLRGKDIGKKLETPGKKST